MPAFSSVLAQITVRTSLSLSMVDAHYFYEVDNNCLFFIVWKGEVFFVEVLRGEKMPFYVDA